MAGLPVAGRVFRKLDASLAFEPQVAEGREIAAGTVLARLSGPVAAILTGERTALNFLQRLSGIATFTRRLAGLIAGSAAALVDARKTTRAGGPGNYAVRLGGARDRRAGLYNGVLIEHGGLAAAASLAQAVHRPASTPTTS